jgi:GNAT superfamily N-acetyltransferase
VSSLVRDARPDDYGAFTRFFAELGVPDPVPTPEQYETRIRPHALMLCEPGDDRPVAYACWRAQGQMARVLHVVVDRARRGRGLGLDVMKAIADRARAAGCTRWRLFTVPSNAPAVRLYERSGMRVVSRASAMRIAWADVARVAGGRAGETSSPRASIVEPQDDAQLEAAFALDASEIAAYRAERARVLLRLDDGDGIAGFAAFDPAFPGAMPFRVRRAALAYSLLEAMRPYARPADSHVRATAEDEGVADALSEAGAETLVVVQRMEGPIALAARTG